MSSQSNNLTSEDFDVLQQLMARGENGIIDDDVYHYPSAIKLENMGLARRDGGKVYSQILPPKKDLSDGNIQS